MPKYLRIVIADDSERARTRVRGLLETQKGLKVIAEAGNGQDVIALVREHVPEIVLMDFDMPVLNGFQALKRIRQDKLPTQVIMVSGRTDRALVVEAQQLGAQGYVSKFDLEDDLIQAIEAFVKGEWYVSRSLKPKHRTVAVRPGDKESTEKQKQRAGVRELDLEKPIRGQQKVKQNVSAQNGEDKIIISILDDSPLVWQLVAPALEQNSQFRVIKNSLELTMNRNEESALQLVAQESPHIILLDLLWQTNKWGGWKILEQLRKSYSYIKVIIFSDSNGLAYVNEAVERGAKGYVAKIDWEDDLSEAILEVYKCKSYYSRSVPRPENRQVGGLTQTEHKVFMLYVRGRTRDEIAQELFPNERGKANYDTHVSNMKRAVGHRLGWQGVLDDDPELIANLSAKERDVFNLYMGGLTTTGEIAKELGELTIVVEARMQAIRRKLVLPPKPEEKRDEILGCHPKGWIGHAQDMRLID